MHAGRRALAVASSRGRHRAPKGPKRDAGPNTDRDTAREKTAQNDRAAKNQSGLGSNPSARDVTSGRHSGNQ